MALKNNVQNVTCIRVCVFIYTHYCRNSIIPTIIIIISIINTILWHSLDLLFTHSLMMTISRFNICYKVLISWNMRVFCSSVRFTSGIIAIDRRTATIGKQNAEKYAKLFRFSRFSQLNVFCFWHNFQIVMCVANYQISVPQIYFSIFCFVLLLIFLYYPQFIYLFNFGFDRPIDFESIN